jgi:plastocyanin
MARSKPIIRFTADRDVIRPGECATIRWHVEGVKEVYFFAKDQGWRGHGVVGEGERQVCPSETTEYRLRVIKHDDSKEVRNIVIQVRAEVPHGGRMFSVDRTEIQPGECVTFRWHVEGVKAVYFFAEGQRWRDHGVVGAGEQRVCPSQTTEYRLRVIKRDDSAEVHRITVQVRARTVSKVVREFAVDRFEIRPGECVTFRWRVEGVKAVYFHPEGQHWQDYGVAGGAEKQVCPSQTTSYCLRVIKTDDSLENHYITVTVRG